MSQIDSLVAERVNEDGRDATPGETSALTAEGPNIDDPSVMSQLATARSGSELLVSEEGKVVFRPGDNLDELRAKAFAYLTEDTEKGNPRYNTLISRIDSIQLATISDLSLGEIPDDVDDSERIWVEVWTRGGRLVDNEERSAILAAVQTFSRLQADDASTIPVFRGQERDVYLVSLSGQLLKALPTLLPEATEVHRAPSVFPIVLAESQDLAGQLCEVERPKDGTAIVAIHDSGVDGDHPYVSPILLGADSVVPGEPAVFDRDGHGTQMAGVAAYSKLAEDAALGTLQPEAWLVSVRLLESAADAGGDPDRGAMWAERTVESVAVAERIASQSKIIHNLSIGADNESRGRSDRTAWSVAVDLLAWNNGNGRLLVVASGNTEPPITDRNDYPYVNLGPPFMQQPAQAWNALSVSGYTSLDRLTAQDQSEHYPQPLASAGQLSPHSRTAPVANRPIKPDIVMEAGNTCPDGSLENPEAQGLTILTLQSSTRGGSLLRRTAKTSPAAAAASNALARIAAAHDDLQPTTWRALLVHTARWPESAVQQFPDRRDLLRAFGYGVPRPERATSSSSNRPVMVYEGALQPSRHSGGQPERRVDFIELPLPEAELHEIGAATVELTVTLSYFVEPTDNLTRRAYAGGRLRWDVQGPTETPEGFRARINRLVRDQGVTPGSGSYHWDIPPDERSRGTLQQGRATMSAAAIAGPRLIAVYPVVGWWEDSSDGRQKNLPYSVVASVDLGDVDIDLYALTARTLIPLPQLVSGS